MGGPPTGAPRADAAPAEAGETPTKDQALAAALAHPHSAAPAVAVSPGAVTLEQLKDAWPEILDAVEKVKRTAWMVVYTASVRALAGDVLTLSFPSENDVASFKQQQAPGQGVSEYLRQAILQIIGLRVKFIAKVDSEPPAAVSPAQARPASADPAPGTQASARLVPPAAARPVSSAPAGPLSSAPARPVGSPAASTASATTASSDTASSGLAPAGSASGSPAGQARTSWPTVVIPVSAPEPGDEPIRAGAIAVHIPAAEHSPGPAAAPAGTPGPAAAAPASTRGTLRSGVSADPADLPVFAPDDIPAYIPDDIPEDIPEGAIRDYDGIAGPAAWADLTGDVPLDVRPTDWDPSDSAPQRQATERFATPRQSAPQGSAGARPTAARPTGSAQAAEIQSADIQSADIQSAAAQAAAATSPKAGRPRSSAPQFGEKQRYGEAVVREILGASFIEERPVAPRSTPGAAPGRES